MDEPQLPRLMPFVPEHTNEIGYVRFHGRNKHWFKASREERYSYLYSKKQLKEFSGPVIDIAESTVKTYVFFNNCHGGFAAKNGLMMKRILGVTEEFSEEQMKLML